MTITHPIHFIGIGGAGMAGLAELCHQLGYSVSGSDISQNLMIDKLKKLGITICPAHLSDNIKSAKTVVYSSAISEENPELAAARSKGCTVLHRSQMLAEIASRYNTIAITGTHGKTTTSSLLSSVLLKAGYDPSFIIGGYLFDVGSHAYLGHGRDFVIEADESDASLLHLPCNIAVITNIDQDHMQTYNNDIELLKSAFLQFIHQLPRNGLAILCRDDPVCAEIIPWINRPLLTYGFDKKADIRAVNYEQRGETSIFQLMSPHTESLFTMTMGLPGQYNVLNALAVIAVAYAKQLPMDVLANVLPQFSGVGRRFERIGMARFDSKSPSLVIDDYAHHPREIEALVSAVRRVWPTRNIIAVFQPHRYSRTRELWASFVDCWAKSEADAIVMMGIYSAGEPADSDVTGAKLAEAIESAGRSVHFLADETALESKLEELTEGDDVILMIGAGSITQYAHSLVKAKSTDGKVI